MALGLINHSTTTGLIQMYDSWVEEVEKKQLTGVCFLDLSAAFDIVDHPLLLQKLKLYGFAEDSLGWVESYLSGRNQTVYIEGIHSKVLPVPLFLNFLQMNFQNLSMIIQPALVSCTT